MDIQDISIIIEQLDTLMPQLVKFIKQFHDVVIASDINVVTDGDGNLSGYPLKSMPEADANIAIKKIGIIDNLIHSRQETISELFKKGFAATNDPVIFQHYKIN